MVEHSPKILTSEEKVTIKYTATSTAAIEASAHRFTEHALQRNGTSLQELCAGDLPWPSICSIDIGAAVAVRHVLQQHGDKTHPVSH